VTYQNGRKNLAILNFDKIIPFETGNWHFWHDLVEKTLQNREKK